MNEQQQEQPPKRKGLTKMELVLLAIAFLAVLYFLQKSGCSVTTTKENIEWIDK